MTKTETTKFLMIMQAAFPNYNPPSKEIAVNMWQDALKDYEYNLCVAALKTFYMTEKSAFAPSIGQLIDKIHLPDDMAYPTEQEAWWRVSKACSNSTYHASEEFNALPEIVQKAVGNPGTLRRWAQAEEGFDTVIYSQFLRLYKKAVNSDKEMRRMPKEMRMLISQTSQKMIAQQED